MTRRRLLFSLLFFGAVCTASAEVPKFIDTQAQFEPYGNKDFPGSIRTMLKEMDRVGISKTLIVPVPFPAKTPLKYDAEEIAEAIGQHHDRFGFLAGGGSINGMIVSIAPTEVTDEIKARFRARCEKILALGALGFGEVTAEHLSLPGMKSAGAPHRRTFAAPDHPLLLLLADIAAEKDVPIDIHFDIFPATIPTPAFLQHGNPPELKENKAAFERLLSHNRKARFNWAHLGSDPAGQRTPELMRELLTRHPNLYSAFRIMEGGADPLLVLKYNETLKPTWRALIQDFPDRFTVHTDIFYSSSWPPRRGPKVSHELAKKLLAQLPPDVARKLAYENAQRIYKLKDWLQSNELI